MNINANISDQISKQFESVCNKYNLQRDVVIEALMAEYLQDLQDGEDAVLILAQNNPRIPLEQIAANYGLDN